MNKDLKFLLKRAFDAGTMYEATLSEECSFNEFIKYVESQQLSICDVVSSNVKISNKSIKKKRPEILINQIWESNIRDDFYKVLSTTNNKVELVNIKNVWDMKIICKESLHNYFTLQIKSE